MTRKSFENLTIVSITGSNHYVQGSIYAIQRSCEALKGAKGLLICPELPPDIVLPDNITHREVAPFGYMEYNLFVLYQLDYFIHTDYCLIVQNDGWVLNADNWRDEFWDYDYIGAPVPIYCLNHPNGGFETFATATYLEHLDWINDPKYIEPQNGGFSLRSKRLLGLPRKLDLYLSIMPPNPVEPNERKHKLQWHSLMHNEDIFLSALHRPTLMAQGIRFAPSELAYDFAVESMQLHLIRQKSPYNVLGCHFFGNIRLVGYNRVEIDIRGEFAYDSPENIENSIHVQLFTKLGYDVHIVLHRPA